MFSLLTTPIVSHLVAAGLGAAGAWYATHRTAVKTALAAAEAAAKAVAAKV